MSSSLKISALGHYWAATFEMPLLFTAGSNGFGLGWWLRNATVVSISGPTFNLMSSSDSAVVVSRFWSTSYWCTGKQNTPTQKVKKKKKVLVQMWKGNTRLILFAHIYLPFCIISWEGAMFWSCLGGSGGVLLFFNGGGGSDIICVDGYVHWQSNWGGGGPVYW